LDAITGLALAAAVTLWWLGRTRLALEDGSDPGRSAADALHALLLVRGMAVGMAGVRVGASLGWRPGAVASLVLIAPSWPLLVLAWCASTTPLWRVALAESLLVAAALVLPAVGSGLRRAMPRADLAAAMGTALGAALVAFMWFARGWSALPLP
jgi:hypothetical protein